MEEQKNGGRSKAAREISSVVAIPQAASELFWEFG